MINILYNDLKSRRDNNNLIPGEQYRITDYVTTISKTDYTSGNHAFDVVVTALDTNILYDYAKALQHEGDTYFDGVNFSLWSIKYNIDNIIPGYTNNWVDPLGKGCIYYMADEFANEAPFDFKNIKLVGKYLYFNLSGIDNSLHGQSFDNSIKDLIVDGEFIIPTAQYTGDCYNIEFGYNCDRLTVYNSHDVNLGDNNYDVTIGNSNVIQIGDDNNDVTIIGTTTGNIGSGNGKLEIDNGHIITIGNHNNNVDLGNNNSGTVIGDNNNDIIVGTDVTGIVIVDGNTDITIGNDNNDVTIEDSDTVVTGNDNTGVTVNTGNGVTLGVGNGKLTIDGGKTVVIGNNTHQIVIGGGTDIVVEDDVTDVDVNPDVVDITIGVGDASGEGTTSIGQDDSGSTTITNGDQTVVVDPITGDVTIIDPVELPKDILRYSPQTLTPEQQLQARTNIGAGVYELTYDDVVDALTYEPISTDKLGVANGLATLDDQGYVLNAQLPSYVDDIIEVDTFTLLPVTGEKGKIYIVTDSGKTYRWATTQYVTISESLTLGTGSEQAYPGNLGAALRIDVDGKANTVHTHIKSEVGLANVDNTSDTAKPVSTATQTALNSKANTSHTHTKSEVGLANVDNTSDVNKPVSNATQTALNSKANKATTLSGYGITDAVTQTDILYADLLALINNDGLIPSSNYRITNYTTTTVQADTQSAGHDFDIIVTALSANELSEDAKCVRKAGDTYFTNANLEAWEIKYCIDNDTSRFAWANTVSGKGVIYYMKDENGNECPYDFKNIQFLNNGVYVFTFGGTTDDSLTGNSIRNTIKESISSNKLSLNFNTFGTNCSFNILGFNSSNNTFGDYCNSNTFGEECQSNKFGYDCYSNKFGYSFRFNTLSDESGLNMFGDSCWHNTLGNGCYNNKLGNEFISNIFGDDCYNNTFGGECSDNTFDDYCYYNTFGDLCSNNNFGVDCGSNTFGKGCGNSTFGDECTANTFGDFCGNNTFGAECRHNKFGNNYYSNTLGDECFSNTFGNDCNSNKFGDSCGYNTFGTYCWNNTFNNYFDSITFGSNCNYNNFYHGISGTVKKDNIRYIVIEDGCRYNNFYSPLITTGGDYLQRIRIKGLENTSATPVEILLTDANTNYEWVIAKNSDGTIEQYCPEDINEDISDLQANKANTSHTHTKSEVGLANVDNTSDLTKPISTATQTALNSKANTSHTHTKSEVGLANVDNTSDLTKPISTATQTALNSKADISHTHTKSEVGLANVDNTSDLTKPISTATQTALNSKANTVHTHTKSEVGLANVDNTSDANKPISNATQTALNSKANKATTLSGYGITDAVTTSAMTSHVESNLHLTEGQRTKLNGIAAGAEVNVNADWNATTGDARILNKPTIPTVPSDVLIYGTQVLTNPQKLQARTNIGAGTSSFSGSYNDLSNKPNIIPDVPTDNKTYGRKNGNWTQIDTSGGGGGGDISTLLITWSDLKSLCDTGTLVPGQSYRITDYVCKTTTTNSQAVNNLFDIVVIALDESHLSENASATYHVGNTYFSSNNAKLESWKLKYCIDNDTSRFEWANTLIGRGVIYYMKDDKGNEVPYDFKNIQYRKNSVWLYTFGGTTDNSVVVDSTNSYCNNNTIGAYNENVNQILKYKLSFNTFGVKCNFNRFGNDCNSNTFGDSCYSNTFGDYCNNNTFGPDCFSNRFGVDCNSNIFGDFSYSNTFGNQCNTNVFGDYCWYNTLGDFSGVNTFGFGCSENTFGNRCGENMFGTWCSSNTFGNWCSNNKFYHGTSGTTPKNFIKYIVLEDGCTYNNFYSSLTTSNNNYLQRIRIKGLEYTNIQINLLTANTKYEWAICRTSGNVLKQYCPDDD